MNACHDPWRITAPWYEWAQAGVPASGRHTPPLIQKFASDDFVNGFIGDPQHSLVFDERADRIHTLQFVEARPGALTGKIAALFPRRDKDGQVVAPVTKARLDKTGLRKIYLPTHGRHYLVVCELHCDVPGFPAPAADAACQAGFVVRRRRLDLTPEQRPEALALLRELVQAQSALAELDEVTPRRPGKALARAARLLRLKKNGSFEDERLQVRQAMLVARARLQDWRAKNGLRDIIEGWLPSTTAGVGSWQPLADETPQTTLTEAWFPLYPCFAPPRAAEHAARGRALYYGVLPATAFDLTGSGEPRFDDRSTYEIRCFARQHDCRCPRAGLNADAPDCDGPLTWSGPTEAYRLAPQFDLQGTANRPVTIQMPDLAELAAQASARPLGQFSPVRFVHPQQMSSKTDGAAVSGGSLGPAAICHFSIPLITIIASFVLNLFLPIVVLVFNLWFLLALRFCIPPSFEVAGGLQAELALIPPKLDIDAELSVDVDAGSFALLGKNTQTIQAELADAVAAKLSETTGIDKSKVKGQLSGYSNAPLAVLSNMLWDKARMTAAADGSTPGTIDLVTGLVYRPRRICQWKHEPFLPTTGEFS